MSESRIFTFNQCINENIPLSAGYRDFEGYKGQTPDPQWPGGAKICVSIVLNYEEGGEYRYKASRRMTILQQLTESRQCAQW